RTVFVGAVSGVRVVRRRHSAGTPRWVDRQLRGIPGVQRRALLHLASSFLKRHEEKTDVALLHTERHEPVRYAWLQHPLVGASALLIALTIMLTWPQVLHLGTKVASHNDPLLSMWRLSWIA